MQDSINFCTLKREDFENIFHIVIEANRSTFPLLVHKYQTMQSFEEETRTAIEDCFRLQEQKNTAQNPIQFNYGMRVNGKLVAVMLSLDLRQQYETMKPIIEDKTNLSNQFCSQFTYLNIESLDYGTATYFTRLSVQPEYMGKGLGKKLVYESCKYLMERGYKWTIIGSIVEASFHMFVKMGGEVIRHVEAVRPGFTYQIRIIKVDFQRLIQIYQKSISKP